MATSVSTSRTARKPSAGSWSCPSPPPHVRNLREDLPNQIELPRLACNEIGRRGTLAKHDPITVLERFHSSGQKLPEQRSPCCSSSLSRSVYFVIHCIEHFIPLVRLVPRTPKRFPKLRYQNRFPYSVLRVREVSTEPVVQERKLILHVGARYPVYGAIKNKNMNLITLLTDLFS